CKGGAGLVLLQVAVEIVVVGSQHKSRLALDQQVLRRIGVMPARICTDSGKQFNVVALHQAQAPLGIQAYKILRVVRVDAAMVTAGLPRRSGVIAKLLLLNPDDGLGKKIDASHVVPVGVTNDNVGDFFRLHARKLHGFVRAQEILDGKFLEPPLAMKAAVEQNVVPAAANQPHGKNDVDLFVHGSSYHQVGD